MALSSKGVQLYKKEDCSRQEAFSQLATTRQASDGFNF